VDEVGQRIMVVAYLQRAMAIEHDAANAVATLAAVLHVTWLLASLLPTVVRSPPDDVFGFQHIWRRLLPCRIEQQLNS
jgi:hypothetical protein